MIFLTNRALKKIKQQLEPREQLSGYFRKGTIMNEIIPVELIQQKIFLIRGHKVMLDSGLAELYGVETSNLNKAIKRNSERFPEDFMFQLTREETDSLRFQFGILETGEQAKSQSVETKRGRGQHRKYLPYVFTEQGVAMLSSVLHSKRAIQVNIAIMRAFVKLKAMLSTNKELAHKLAELENKIEKHDGEIKLIFDAIRQMMAPPEKMRPKIGFRREGGIE
jgi:phage regulator Rha-like protein